MASERTLSIIKPDAVAKNVVGQILSRFETAALHIVACKMMHLSREQAEVVGQLLDAEIQHFPPMRRRELASLTAHRVSDGMIICHEPFGCVQGAGWEVLRAVQLVHGYAHLRRGMPGNQREQVSSRNRHGYVPTP